ncbi:MAG: response regulator [Candidatus Zixiibacteriota bacterium]
MKVLVVDDDPVTLGTINGFLTPEGFEVVAAATVKQAIQALDAQRPIRLIIADIMMPSKDGFELLNFLHSNLRYRKVPVLICSALGAPDIIVKSIQLGARDFLKKPIIKENLLAHVKKLVAENANTVLIVDDQKTIADLLKRVVEREGYASIVVDSGEEALEALAANPVVAVISEIVLPGMSGFDLLVSIKDQRPTLPVLMITGSSEQFNREDAIGAGADGYITKPFKNVEIVRKLTHLIMNRTGKIDISRITAEKG